MDQDREHAVDGALLLIMRVIGRFDVCFRKDFVAEVGDETGRGGWHDFLELAICHPLASKGWSDPLPPNSALLMQNTPR